VTPGPPVIERPGRRPPRLVWRDRCVTAALWTAWCYPVEALARLTAPEMAARITGTAPGASLLGDAFLADVAAAGRMAVLLVGCLLGWGSYARWRAGRRDGPTTGGGRPPGPHVPARSTRRAAWSLSASRRPRRGAPPQA
jgi:hypothetical protein